MSALDLESLSPEIGRARIFTLKQTSEFTGLGPSTLRALHARGELPAVRVGARKLGFQVGMLVDWLAARAETERAP
jgi:hypothetical protein